MEVFRRTITIFVVVGASGSMDSCKIGTFNSAIEEITHEIRKISDENADAVIKNSVLKFSSVTRWIITAPMYA